MKRNRGLLHIVFLLSTIFISCIGTKPYSINLQSGQAYGGEQVYLNINGFGDSIKVKYSIADSVSYRLYNDPLFEKSKLAWQELKSGEKQNKDSIGYYERIMDSLENKYSYFTADTIVIHKNENREYAALVNTVMHSAPNEVTLSAINRDTDHTGGLYYICRIKIGKKVSTVTASSPDEYRYPELNNLIQQSFDLFR